MPELSIIIITRNQEWNIARLIESVLERTACVSSREIVLVDSASTDNTVKIASNYPIKILRLHPDQTLSPLTGRYVGFKYTSGDFILHLDGDMELCHDWVGKALQVFTSRVDTAVVTGEVVDLSKTAMSDDKKPLNEGGSNVVKEVLHGRGAAMYRRSVLEQVGTFIPHIYSDGEPELCLRIRHTGYRILKLDYPIAYHYTDPPKHWSTLVGRWKRRLYIGPGQILRHHIGTEYFWPYFKERAYGIAPLLALVVGILSLILSLLSGQSIWLGLYLLMFAVMIIITAWRKHSLYKTVASLLERLLIAQGTFKGFFLKPMDLNSYEPKLDVVKDAGADANH